MADQVDAPVDGAKLAALEPYGDRSTPDSSGEKLGTRDDPVLPAGELGDHPVDLSAMHNFALDVKLASRVKLCTAAMH